VIYRPRPETPAKGAAGKKQGRSRADKGPRRTKRSFQME